MSGPAQPGPAGADAAPEAAAAAPCGPEQTPAPEFLTAIEAAQVLRWLPDTVRRKAAAGELPGVRLGRHWRFERERLHAYIRGEWQPANAQGRVQLSAPGASQAARIFREMEVSVRGKHKGRSR